MTVTVRVWVALSRPPREDTQVRVVVHVPDDRTIEQAEAEARLTACQIACADRRVVMPVRDEIEDITDI